MFSLSPSIDDWALDTQLHLQNILVKLVMCVIVLYVVCSDSKAEATGHRPRQTKTLCRWQIDIQVYALMASIY